MQFKKILDSRVTAVVAGGIAVVVIGSGASYAANTIRSIDIVNGTIQSVDIKDGSIQVNDLTASARAKLQGQKGATGATGRTGAAGPAGPAGATGPAGPAGNTSIVPVSALTGLFTVTDGDGPKLALTGDGAQFGPFATGNACAGDGGGRDYARLNFTGLNGQPLSALKGFSYEALHRADNDTQGAGVLPVRIDVSNPAGGRDRLTFSPNTQFNEAALYDTKDNRVNEFLVTSGTVRLNDDPGNGPDSPYAEIAGPLAGRTIQNISFLGGCGASPETNLVNILRSVKVNATTYQFGAY